MPKDIRIISRHFFIVKIPNKQEIQQIAFNHSSDVDFRHFMIKTKNKKHILFVIGATLASDNPLHFRKYILERI